MASKDDNDEFYKVTPEDGSAAASVVRKDSKYGKKAMADVLKTPAGPGLKQSTKERVAAMFGSADAAGDAEVSKMKSSGDYPFLKHTTKDLK